MEKPVPGGAASAAPQPDLHDPAIHASLDRYWRMTSRLTVVLLLVWFLAGLGCGVLAAETLNLLRLQGTGYPLGFWFAQQGSILIFVLLIAVYCVTMNRLDARHHAELEALKSHRGGRE